MVCKYNLTIQGKSQQSIKHSDLLHMHYTQLSMLSSASTVTSFSAAWKYLYKLQAVFVFLPKLKGTFMQNGCFPTKKTPIILREALLPWCYERRDLQSWGKEGERKWVAAFTFCTNDALLSFLEHVQLFTYIVLKDYKTRTFIILLTDDTYFKVLPGFVIVPVVLGK